MRSFALSSLSLTIILLAGLTTQANPISNPDFTKSKDGQPQDWKLTNGKGTWQEKGILQVTGDGKDNARWESTPVPFQPGELYQLSTKLRKTGDQGCVTTGPDFANYDHRPGKDWTEGVQTFRVPEGISESPIHLGHWVVDGPVEFDTVKLTKIVPIHLEKDGICLGRGENVLDGTYTFDGYFGDSEGTCHRTFASTTSHFNSYRWCMGEGNTVVYRFDSPEGDFTEAQVEAGICHYVRGACSFEASLDGKTWKTLGEVKEVKQENFPLPAEMLPAKTIFVRAHVTEKGTNLQVDKIGFSAKYQQDQTPKDVAGKTILAAVPFDQDVSGIESLTYTEDYRSGKVDFKLTPKQPSDTATLSITSNGKVYPGTFDSKTLQASFTPSVFAKEQPLELTFSTKGQKPVVMQAELTWPDFYRADYGERFSLGNNTDTAVWWCRADHKVPRVRRLPEKKAKAVKLAAAKNDRESVQVIVTPTQDIKGLQATMSDLAGPNGATLPSQNVKVLRAYYHRVRKPTDGTGLADWWPDALPPLDKPLDVAAGTNQPIWLVVHVPEGTTAGEYTGKLHLTAENFDTTVPVQMTVWNYTLPKRNHIDTAFGLEIHNIFRYHGAKTEADQRKLLDLYFQSFAEHRISPYDPVPFDGIRVTFDPKSDPPSAKVDFSRFDAAMEKAVAKYNFTDIRLPIQGMGGGTFHSRSAPSIHGFTENTPEYQAMFSSYVQQLQNHLKEKGWLDMAYIYWFDEPAPKDYEFVSNGMSRLKKYAPELKTMLTVHMEPNDELRDIDIWCPVSNRYDTSMPGLAKDHTVWWYVCTGPKAPYCTLFIDHAATELRVWHWQAWKRNIVGSLVWTSNYWTSSAAYPDKAQNPYEDPMGYVSGYSTPKGVKRYWGNGDGRFIYPPLAVAEPGLAGDQPVIAPPVSSIRWEMLREGVEDWESLYLLRELINTKRESLSPELLKEAESLLSVPESITVDMTHFTTDPEPIYTHREKVAKMIEKLSQ